MATAQSSGQAPTQTADQSAAASSAGQQTALGGDPPNNAPNPATGDAAKAGEVKAGEAAKTGERGKDSQQQAKAPEKYADFKVPDGMTVDTALVERIAPALREANVSQEQAQKVVDGYAAHIQAQQTDFESKLATEDFALAQAGELLMQQRETWAGLLKSDPEIGGAKQVESTQIAMRAIARFGSPALKNLLNVTGLGNHPELVKFCLRVGQKIREDSTSLDNATQGGRRSTEDVFYGGQKAS